MGNDTIHFDTIQIKSIYFVFFLVLLLMSLHTSYCMYYCIMFYLQHHLLQEIQNISTHLSGMMPAHHKSLAFQPSFLNWYRLLLLTGNQLVIFKTTPMPDLNRTEIRKLRIEYRITQKYRESSNLR